MITRIVVASFIWLTCLPIDSQSLYLTVNQKGFTGSLRETLGYVASTFHVPMVGECYSSSTRRIVVKPGLLSATEVIRQVVSGEGLSTQRTGNVLHVFDKSLIGDPRNALNHRFAAFSVSSDADSFLMILPARLHNDMGKDPSHPTIGGFALSGVRNPSLQGKLVEEKLHDVSARELLLKEASSSSFWVVVFYSEPTKQGAKDKQNTPIEGLWIWGSFSNT